MRAGRAISTLILYELRRAVARRRIILLVALIFLAEAGLYLVLTRLPATLTAQIQGYAWIIGVLVPSTLLVHVLALTIGASAFSEEYEMGTADFWLTKPLTRLEYFIGKTAGSIAFTALIVTTYTSLALALSTWIFGPQQRLDLVAPTTLHTIYSALAFLFIGLAAGELLRRSMFATIIAALGFFASLITEFYISIVTFFTPDQALADAARLLPTWGATRLTSTYIQSQLPMLALIPTLGTAPTPAFVETWQAALNIALYTAAFCAAALIRLARSDVTRRAL
ncbi:hypothetical protein HRbin02_01675 [Candidatus Calditenuaceae archaeon HR02]|nr:hypothetical protein HRbin02_01675 [Candidatus Calditenuaceae archaeon HR02]